jgi:hypothetical protein
MAHRDDSSLGPSIPPIQTPPRAREPDLAPELRRARSTLPGASRPSPTARIARPSAGMGPI